MLHYLQEDNDLEKAQLDLENYLKSKTCSISEHEKGILRKLVEEIRSCAYSSGRANCDLDHSEND